MNLLEYLQARLPNEIVAAAEGSAIWARITTDGSGPALAVGLAEGLGGEADVLIELHADQSYASADLGSLLSLANNWNRTHRLSRARVEPSSQDTDRSVVVLDAWLPTTAGVADETIAAFLDAAIVDMLSFWSTEGDGHAAAE